MDLLRLNMCEALNSLITGIKHFESLHYFIINIMGITLPINHNVKKFIEIHLPETIE